ncbi:GNAT family N-acetyltransferase [Ulvibacterium marinum]|uniref:GNAT family N-acetyltransferase n=1 Tax=Ulvibacterium marinum TaxID=2419782 RepID=A0A3B0BVB5_9FLAO|nr:GNAT family N-acetyltransferase [Ulvibacterium marinum]RKN76932.1 GNAT family N-acetyltransferase [Ulvibacterium marinum]
MQSNPFTSNIFTTTWSKHFNNDKLGISFDFFENISFIKHKFLNLYINVGTTVTKGITYSLTKSNPQDLGDEVFLIYDVPAYFAALEPLDGPLKRIIVKQYPGYLIELHGFKDLNGYMNVAFNRKSRYKLKSYKRQLEANYDIQYRMYYGDISRNEYDLIFEQFRQLLVKRYEDKRVSNNNLEDQEWSFYKEVVYPMILNKKASLYVVFDNKEPIGVMLNYMSGNAIHVAITVFDIEYRKSNVGTVNIMNLIEWSLENNFRILDFSKGHYDYKQRWGSLKYDFEYHIIYNSNSFYSKSIAFSLKYLFQLKQYLRDKKVNELLHKFTFMFGKKTKAANK